MARKLNIPKAAQIRGIRKALANPKTPKQFRAGLKKRLAKLLACILFSLLASSARGQTPVSIVPTQQTLAPTGTACTGTAQAFNVQNRNQTQHHAYAATSGATSLVVQIFGVDTAGNTYLISDSGTQGQAGVGSSAAITASGYFPTVQVQVTCLPVSATFLLNYTGSQAEPVQTVGAYQVAQLDKVISSNASAGALLISAIQQTPLGNSYGKISFAYVGTSGPSGSTLLVECLPSTNTNPTLYTFTPSTSTGAQFFYVPAGPCVNITIEYSPGGASSSVYAMDYIFEVPGFAIPNLYLHVTGTTATVVKPGPGTVHTLVIGTPAAGTISLFDLASTSCTGTPATSVVSVVTATTTFPSAPEIYDVQFNAGICLKASAAMDITVSYQ